MRLALDVEVGGEGSGGVAGEGGAEGGVDLGEDAGEDDEDFAGLEVVMAVRLGVVEAGKV